MGALYLRPEVVVEPLYQQWYAWPHLIAPATAAMNVRHRHLRIMESFVQAPGVHERFARDPAMIGSPYMDLPATRKPEIQALRDRTVCEFAHVLALADAIAELDRLVREEARGFALDELYTRVPAALRGYVELFYEVDHRPGYRFIESLLYRSRYYDVSAQSVALSVVEQDVRPFALSTPRLDNGRALHLAVPFASPALDALFSMRTRPGSYSHVRDLFEISEQSGPAFRCLFTEQPPPRHDASAHTGGARIRYFGHACILVETARRAILVDPAISASVAASVPRFTYADLPENIDCVLITHDHQDHVLLDALLQLRQRIGRVIVPRNVAGSLADPSLRLIFQALGFRDVVELDELQPIQVGGCTITGVPFLGEHADLRIASKLGFHLRLDSGFTILLAADSNSPDPELARHVHDALGDVDMLFIGMECDGAPLSWLYGPLLSSRLPRGMDHSRRLSGSDCATALAHVDTFHPSEVYVYAMGQEPWLRHIMALEYAPSSRPIVESDRLVAECRARGVSAERLFGMKELHRGH